MADVDFFLSNPAHHLAMFAPVVAGLRDRGVTSRVRSLCELRGFDTPHELLLRAGAEVERLWPRWLARRRTAGGATPGAGRGALYTFAWRALIEPRLGRSVPESARLAVLPNDDAFPYDRLAAWLRRRGIDFVLAQEGARFTLPLADSSYGLGGARALAVWGEASADHFRSIGIPRDRIYVTGSPRFDGDVSVPEPTPWREGEPLDVLLVTNPIDAQGFCSRAEKLALARSFVAPLEAAIADGSIRLALRPHPGEGRDLYTSALGSKLRFADEEPLDRALDAADVVVIMSSTVGLEALRRHKPLAVLATPGHGFVHDYVSSGAALGIVPGPSLPLELLTLARPDPARQDRARQYVDRHVAHAGRATRTVVELMIGLLDEE